jgi:integrase
MASVHRRENGRWCVRWRDPDGRQRCKTLATKPEAQRYANTVEQEQAVRPLVAVHPVVRFDDYAVQWQERQIWRPNTRTQVEIYVRRYLVPAFGSRPVASIRHAEVQTFVRSLSETLAPATVRLIVAHLRSMMGEAVRDRLIQENPTRHVKVPRLDRRPVPVPSPEQVTTLAAHLPSHLVVCVELAAGAGLRLGEVLGLTVDRVDYEAQTIRVDRQLDRSGMFAPPKSEASVRTVPVPSQLLDKIREHLEAHGAGRLGLVVSDADGEPIKRRDFSKLWQPAARAAGLPPRTGLHCCRHFYASLLIRAGCSVKVVQAALGHATAAETLDTYSHLWPDDGDRTRAAVAALWSR